MYLNIQFCTKKPARVEYFNCKNQECQKAFFQETSNTLVFDAIFESEEGVDVQGTKWFKKVNKCFYKSFNKIRLTGKTKETKLSQLFDKRRDLVQKLKKADDIFKEEIEEKLNEIDEELSEIVADENRKKVIDNFKEFSTPDGLLNTNGMWKVKVQFLHCRKTHGHIPDV